MYQLDGFGRILKFYVNPLFPISCVQHYNNTILCFPVSLSCCNCRLNQFSSREDKYFVTGLLDVFLGGLHSSHHTLILLILYCYSYFNTIHTILLYTLIISPLTFYSHSLCKHYHNPPHHITTNIVFMLTIPPLPYSPH